MAKKTSSPKPATAAKKTAATASNAAIRQAIEAGEGLLRLAPTWVPRSFLMPGRRLKLHPSDLYALGRTVAASTNAGSRPPPRPPTPAPRPTRG